jgi:hypothetical protein
MWILKVFSGIEENNKIAIAWNLFLAFGLMAIRSGESEFWFEFWSELTTSVIKLHTKYVFNVVRRSKLQNRDFLKLCSPLRSVGLWRWYMNHWLSLLLLFFLNFVDRLIYGWSTKFRNPVMLPSSRKEIALSVGSLTYSCSQSQGFIKIQTMDKVETRCQ